MKEKAVLGIRYKTPERRLSVAPQCDVTTFSILIFSLTN